MRRRPSLNNPYRTPAVAIGLSLMLAALFTVPVSASLKQEWQFDVYLDDRMIGEHSFSVQQEQGVETVRTQANFDVKVLFIKAFSYAHKNVEVWQDGCLREINAITVLNGERSVVKGQKQADTFTARTNQATQSFSGCVNTFAYWNPEFLQNNELLNSQTGELEAVTITDKGEEPFQLGDQVISANRYEVLLENTPIDLWYAEDGRWLGLETVAKGGRALRYQPTQLPEPLPAS